MYFQYGEKEIAYLKQKDPKLGDVIDQVGMVKRAVDPDLFSSVVHHIVGQQISTKAQATIWKRVQDVYKRQAWGCPSPKKPWGSSASASGLKASRATAPPSPLPSGERTPNKKRLTYGPPLPMISWDPG